MSKKRNANEAWVDKENVSYRQVRINKELILNITADKSKIGNIGFIVSLNAGALDANLNMDGQSLKRLGQLLLDAYRRKRQQELETLGKAYGMRRL